MRSTPAPAAPGATRANSSPPMRARQSPSRTTRAHASATARRTASPIGWPCSSLTALKPSKSKRMRAAAPPSSVARRQGVVEAAAVVEARQRVALGHAALDRLGRQQAVLEVVHRDRLPGDGDEEEDAAGRVAELDRLRVVGQRAEERAAEEGDQRPRQAGREEVGDEQRGEEQHRLQVAVRAAGGPQGTATTGIIPAVTPARRPMVIVRAVRPSQSERTPQPAAKPASTSATARCGCGVPGIASTATPTTEVASHIRPEIRSGSGPSSWSGPRVRAGGFMALVHPRGRLRRPPA